jgi:hypothetical protein
MGEKQAAFIAIAKAEGAQKHAELLFLFHVAPILKQIKPAALVSIKTEDWEVWEGLRLSTKLCAIKIRRRGNHLLLMIFDKAALLQTLDDALTRDILQKCGYLKSKGLGTTLRRLKERMKTDDFPHEIGLFLGYPPADVEAFIQNLGRNYTCCRYWKVYTDVARAEKIWHQIDEAQRHAFKLINRLLSVHETVKILQTI